MLRFPGLRTRRLRRADRWRPRHRGEDRLPRHAGLVGRRRFAVRWGIHLRCRCGVRRFGSGQRVAYERSRGGGSRRRRAARSASPKRSPSSTRRVKSKSAGYPKTSASSSSTATSTRATHPRRRRSITPSVRSDYGLKSSVVVARSRAALRLEILGRGGRGSTQRPQRPQRGRPIHATCTLVVPSGLRLRRTPSEMGDPPSR